MINPESAALITLDGEDISISQAFSYLRLFGRLQPFIHDLLSYHVLQQEMQANPALVVTTNELGQTVLDFRVRQNLTDPSQFGDWLTRQGSDYPTFESQVVVGLKLEKLKQQILDRQLPDYFAEHGQDFDYVELSYIVAAREDLAHDIKGRIDAGTSFEQIGYDHPLDAEQTVVVKRDLLRRHKLREEIKAALAEGANPGQLVGPIPMGARWCIFRLEQLMPVVLDDQIRQELKELFFNQWMAERIAQLQVGPSGQPETGDSTPGQPEAERVEALSI
ncbi:MAG: peptidylprolyl isomerase [Nodosilinea sp.]